MPKYISPYQKGAMDSLDVTCRELLKFMGKAQNLPYGQKRAILNSILADFALRSYRHGFKRAHKLIAQSYLETDEMPKTLVHKARRRLAPTQIKKIKVRSRIK